MRLCHPAGEKSDSRMRLCHPAGEKSDSRMRLCRPADERSDSRMRLCRPADERSDSRMSLCHPAGEKSDSRMRLCHPAGDSRMMLCRCTFEALSTCMYKKENDNHSGTDCGMMSKDLLRLSLRLHFYPLSKDSLANFFSGPPPFAYVKNFGPHLWPREKILAPPS